MKKNNLIYLLALVPLLFAVIVFVLPQSDRKQSDIVYGYESIYNNTITVTVEGEVLRSGTYVMYKDSTIKDLLKKCGTTDYTNIKGLSLDEVLKDGGIYEISISSDSLKSVSITLKNSNFPTSNDDNSNSSSSNNNNLINLNTATLDELKQLEGIGDVKAQAIIDYRNTKKFTSKEELKNVNGISEAIYNANKNKITV